MSVRHRWQGERFVVQVTGTLDISESSALFDRFYGDPRSERARSILFDCTDCERFVFTDGDIATMSALEFGGSRDLPITKIAFVGAGPAIRPFYDRYLEFYETVYEKVDARWQIELFDELPAAEAWLDAEDEAPRP